MEACEDCEFDLEECLSAVTVTYVHVTYVPLLADGASATMLCLRLCVQSSLPVPVAKMSSANPHFIHCIKPNNSKVITTTKMSRKQNSYFFCKYQCGMHQGQVQSARLHSPLQS